MAKNELAILGLLREGEKYGYQIHQQISERNMDIWAKISISSIYNTLNKLREKGMVEARKLKVGKTPERSIYHITTSGEQMLAKLVEGYLATRDMGEYPFGLGVAFISSIPKQKVIELIEKRISRLERELVDFEDRINAQSPSTTLNWYLLMKNGRNHMEIELEWCRELLAEIKKVDSWRDLKVMERVKGVSHEHA